jgi:TP901 family phage tail tape measure protein
MGKEQDLPVIISVEDKQAAARLDLLNTRFKGFSEQVSKGLSTANIALGAFLGSLGSQLASRALSSIAASIRETVDESRQFSKAMAEVNSILPTNTRLTDEAKLAFTELSAAYGTSAAQQAKAYYEIVSAGIMGTRNQMELLRVANQAATAGLTDTKVSADVLTSALNTFGKQGLTAQKASDQLFVAVREGKTRFEELAGSLGRVTPVAQAAGLSFGETAGTIAFLTKSGISTEEAVTGVRAVLAQVIRPSEEATAVARRLGIEFNTAGLEAKGMGGFLKDLAERTGGNEDILGKLFPDIRGLVPILATVRGDFADFNRVLELTKNASGDTARALDEIKNSLDFQLTAASSRAKAITSQIFILFEKDLVNALKSFNANATTSLSGVIDMFVLAGKALTFFVMRPLELVINGLKVGFSVIRLQIQGVVASLGSIGQVAAIVAEKFGARGPLIEGLQTFGEASREVFVDNFKDVGDNLKKSLTLDMSASDSVNSYFDKIEERAAQLQPQIEAVKQQITSGMADATMAVSVDPSDPAAGGMDPFAGARLGLNAFESALVNAFDTTVPASLEQFKAFVESVKAFSQQIKTALMGGIANGAGQAFAAFGKAIAQGEDPLKAFLNTFMQTMGQMAIQVGTMFILQGLAYTFAGLPNGPALIAAGAALAVFGGVMGAVFSGGGSGAGGYAGQGTGVSTLSSADEFLTPSETQEKQKTEINVQVQGNIFDGEETGLRIVDAIRDSIERDGVTLVRTA